MVFLQYKVSFGDYVNVKLANGRVLNAPDFQLKNKQTNRKNKKRRIKYTPIERENPGENE